MIESPRSNLYVSSNGFSVEVLGRTGMRYTTGSRSLSIDSEVLDGPSGIGLYSSSISRWDSPHESDVLTMDERTVILANIQEVFAHLGFSVSII